MAIQSFTQILPMLQMKFVKVGNVSKTIIL